ncbi:class I SAM-dependent methyltransferase [Desulfallas thermosapovorans]|uniref:Ubiquinone/menaquinone biosynthesis C-methylase UbiE n=1 Tax=Desulfallas thermosapovorans DSM 6562 TaxID=1121431 RepID=A0A5S4ZNS7_9FIRM|nr:methyltransferase [Desulfallas thermosapovorans]TYO93948.1 ubiquinone/menaquinone biosynthesis C-methylase UbiE [Desulfallas thermosapovorans DSM 6562]
MPNTGSFQLPQEFLIVGAAVQTGLFEELKNTPCTLEELATKTQTDQRALWVVVEALIALKYLEYEGERVKLSQEADNIFYNPDHEQYTGFSFMHAYNLIKSWIQLPAVIKTGKPAARGDNPEHTKHFIKAMSHVAQKSSGPIVDYCLKGLPEKPKILDVGGGPLTYAKAFAAKGARVTVLDLPDVIEMMRPELDKNLPIDMVEGDFTRGLPPGPYDLVYLGNVCHIYGEQENRKLFLDAARELKTAGHIIINDMIRGTGVMPAVFGVNMLINTVNGGTWTYEQYKTWLADAGCTTAPWEEVGGRQLIKATKQ